MRMQTMDTHRSVGRMKKLNKILVKKIWKLMNNLSAVHWNDKTEKVHTFNVVHEPWILCYVYILKFADTEHQKK